MAKARSNNRSTTRPGRSAPATPAVATPGVTLPAGSLSEQTGAQYGYVGMAPFGMFTVGPLWVPPGTFETYRDMRRDPTIALARMLVRAPIEANEWGFEADDGVPDERVNYIQNMLGKMRDDMVRTALHALDMGFQPYEPIYDVRGLSTTAEGSDITVTSPAIGLKRLKPLLQDITLILTDKQGHFVGFEQPDRTRLTDLKAVCLSYDQEGDDYYGRSRFENVRREYAAAQQASKGAERYDARIAGVFPVFHYPPDDGTNVNGTRQSNFDIAKALAANFQAGQPIILPNFFAKLDLQDSRAQGDKKTEIRQWIIELLEDKGSRQPGFMDRIRYFDSLKMRGMLRPEKAALEAAKGGIAGASEAPAMQDISLIDCELIDRWIACEFNDQVVDPLLELNWGPDARGTIRIAPAALQDEKAALIRNLMVALFASPSGIEFMRSWCDVDMMIDIIGIPKRDDKPIDALDPLPDSVLPPAPPTPEPGSPAAKNNGSAKSKQKTAAALARFRSSRR